MKGWSRLAIIFFSLYTCPSSPLSFKDCLDMHFKAKKPSSYLRPSTGFFSLASCTRPNAPIPRTLRISRSLISILGETQRETKRNECLRKSQNLQFCSFDALTPTLAFLTPPRPRVAHWPKISACSLLPSETEGHREVK